MILLLELTAIGWSKSLPPALVRLPPAFFVELTYSEGFYSKWKVQFQYFLYKSKSSEYLNALGLVRSHECHKSHGDSTNHYIKVVDNKPKVLLHLTDSKQNILSSAILKSQLIDVFVLSLFFFINFSLISNMSSFTLSYV